MITKQKLISARAFLGLNQSNIAENIGVTTKTISNIEEGDGVADNKHTGALQQFFEMRGIEFTDFNGIRQKPTGNRHLKGASGFRELYEMLYHSAKTCGGDIILYNGVSNLVMAALGADYVALQKKRMEKIKNNYTYRVIVKEGDDTFFGAAYCDYKWLPEKHFNEKTFFVFGSIFAIVDFENDIDILIIDSQDVADSQKLLFNGVWDTIAQVPCDQ